MQQTKTGWLGDFSERIRTDLKNPKLATLKRLLLPPAYSILEASSLALLEIEERARLRKERKLAKIKRRLGTTTAKRLQEAVQPLIREEAEALALAVVGLEDAVDGVVRFIVCEMYSEAKHLLNIVLRYYPQDLRLYKFYAKATLNDRILNWRNVKLHETLELFNVPDSPDSEIFALKGGMFFVLYVFCSLSICFLSFVVISTHFLSHTARYSHSFEPFSHTYRFVRKDMASGEKLDFFC